jgi:hypothetical protein
MRNNKPIKYPWLVKILKVRTHKPKGREWVQKWGRK